MSSRRQLMITYKCSYEQCKRNWTYCKRNGIHFIYFLKKYIRNNTIAFCGLYNIPSSERDKFIYLRLILPYFFQAFFQHIGQFCCSTGNSQIQSVGGQPLKLLK